MTFGSTIRSEKIIVPDPYEGPYTVTPTIEEQVLLTKYKNMEQNVTVEEIPYAETTNDYGTTVVIAS